MGLLKKPKKKKPLRSHGSGGGVSNERPQQTIKQPPCTGTCPSDNDIRGWLTVIAQREKTGMSLDEAMDKAWMIEMETNPFPSIMGRVCPHPCEGKCNRKEKDGAVNINAVERSIGDWGLERKLKAPMLDVGGPFPEKIAVVGAGPAGLSCAYQMARRGYKVTLFETLAESGGMLRYGIPEYRLPREIIDAEVARIADVGVDMKFSTTIGKDISFDQIRKDHDVVFAAIGAHVGRMMRIPGEDGSHVYTGTEFLRDANVGKPPAIGKKIIVIGGGDTAIDCARVALRHAKDAKVIILYRRTRTEMPAIDREVDEAIEENIDIEFLCAPCEVVRDGDGKMTGVKIQRMELGEPDKSGRRRPVPIEGKIDDYEADTMIAAVSQAPDAATLGAFTDIGWINGDDWGVTSEEKVWTGGDNQDLGIATTAVGHGARAAISMHATLRGEEPHKEPVGPDIGPDRIKFEHYDEAKRNERSIKAPDKRLAEPWDEVDAGITQEQLLAECDRCFSCGFCFGCEKCWMYCTPSCFKKLPEPTPGNYYKVDLGVCDGCKKCAEECPCGFLDML